MRATTCGTVVPGFRGLTGRSSGLRFSRLRRAMLSWFHNFAKHSGNKRKYDQAQGNQRDCGEGKRYRLAVPIVDDVPANNALMRYSTSIDRVSDSPQSQKVRRDEEQKCRRPQNPADHHACHVSRSRIAGSPATRPRDTRLSHLGSSQIRRCSASARDTGSAFRQRH
jgi:hypothetical protein